MYIGTVTSAIPFPRAHGEALEAPAIQAAVTMQLRTQRDPEPWSQIRPQTMEASMIPESATRGQLGRATTSARVQAGMIQWRLADHLVAARTRA